MISVSAHLAAECANEIDAIRTHPWVLGAADGTLDDEAIGTWACQDIDWGDEFYAHVFAAAKSAPGLPAATADAFAWLQESIPPEVAWLNKMAAEYPVAASGHELWPDFTGYGAWMLVTAQKGPEEALTVLQACENSYHVAFTVVRDADPPVEWARWAGQNWAGPGFTQMMAWQAVGLDEYLAGVTSARRAELVEVARGIYRWERRCFTSLTQRRGWDS